MLLHPIFYLIFLNCLNYFLQYPPGYLEAQKAQNQIKDKENKSNLSKISNNSKRGSKRKPENMKDLTEVLRGAPKKTKLQEYKLSQDVEDLIKQDINNEKLWSKCKEMVKEGKQKFLEKVQEVFMCICCQEVVVEPVTTICNHNMCKVRF